MNFVFGAFLIISAQICATIADSPCVCPRNLSPVCGSDGITYNNPCVLNCEAVTSRKQIRQVKSGPCEEPTMDCYCFGLDDPVCGNDGKTYTNMCELSCAQQHANPSLEIAHRGVCE